MGNTWWMLIVPALLLAAVPVAAATAETREATIVWRGVNAFEQAKVTNEMSATVRTSGRCNHVIRPSIFLHPESEGRATLDFPPVEVALDGPARLFFVGYAGLSDGIPWDDENNKADGARFYVSIDGKEVAQTRVGECRWMPLVADMGRVARKRARVAVQLATDSGGANNASYDWALFGEPVLVAVPDSAVPAGAGVEGTAGVVVAQARGGGRVVVEGLDARGDPVPDAMAEHTVEKAGLAAVLFDFNAAEACVAWRWRAAEGGLADARGGSWPPSIEVAAVGPAQCVNLEGEPMCARVAVRNTGMAALVPSHGAVVTLAGKEQPVGRIAPGDTAVVEFDLGSKRRGSFTLDYALKVAGETSRGKAGPFAVWPALPSLPTARPGSARAQRIGEGMFLLENPHVRWLVNLGAPGLGALVWTWHENRWQPVGTVSPLVEVIGADGKPAILTPVAAPPREERPAAPRQTITLRARRECAVAGGAGSITVELRVPNSGDEMEVAVSLRSEKALHIGALRGPAVHAGDRALGAKKGIAFFPGLEYLEGEEPSSSTRDLAPPLHNRVAPHKFKVTVPMMAVETAKGGPAMAVIWDPKQKWDGESMAPAATFASPNFAEQQANHLMRLSLPSVPDGVPENALWSREPYALQPGKELVLRQFIIAGVPQPDATGVFGWFDRLVGFPDVEAWPRPFEEEMDLCRHGFLKTVWDEEQNKGRHVVGWDSGNAPGFATLLLMDARGLAKGETRRTLLERVKVIGEQTLRDAGPAGLMSAFGCHTMRGEFPYHWGHLPEALTALRSDAYGRLQTQDDDGGWAFSPGEKQRVLGEPGTLVSGLCASGAFAMARYAAITGDPEITEGMRKALRNLRRFQVPRGSQGWECPILEPDVLASAYAVRALVWAYMATGEEEWLEDARFWARTGLAFQYAWDDGKHPGMRYASIPVFGSTFFTHSWIGLPVQWCGLVYGYGLRELLRFDDNPVWRKQADGMTVSAMYQQWPMDEKPELAGSYPDSWGEWFTRRNPVHINPENIHLNILAMKGLDPGLRSTRVPVPGGALHVTAPCDLKAAMANAGLRVDLTYPAGETFYLTVAPVAVEEGAQILAGGEALPRREALGTGETGWVLEARTGVLAVGLTADAAGKARLLAKGLRFAPPAVESARAGWEFEGGLDAWLPAHSCELSHAEGRLAITVTGTDPYATSGPSSIDAGKQKRLRVRARVTGGRDVTLFWRTTRSPDWGPDKELRASLPGDGQWHEVLFDLSKHALWAGRVVQIRLDPEPADVPAGTRLEVDWIHPEP